MKRYCKNVNILDLEFIKICVKDCLGKGNKWKRRDVIVYFSNLMNISKAEAKRLIQKDKNKLIDAASISLRKELATRKLYLPPTWYKKKIDNSSGKERLIGIQNIKQQLCDYIAVYGMQELLKRIGEFQCASIPGKGPTWGVMHIRKWLKEKDCNYFVKMDIRKCFPSIPHDKLLVLIDKYVANDNLKWLVHKLVDNMVQGLSIGSYLSQYLCNFYISLLYHEIKENLFYIRRGHRISKVAHLLIYMDDILLIGKNSKELLSASKYVVEYTKNVLGLTIKPEWSINKLTSKTFIDIMGFRIYRDHITIRRKVFIRVRRCYKRALKYKDSLRLARKCNSYKGYIVHTNSIKFANRYKVYKTLKRTRRAESVNSSIFRQRTACYLNS